MEKTVKLLIIVIAIFTLGIGLYACNDKDNADIGVQTNAPPPEQTTNNFEVLTVQWPSAEKINQTARNYLSPENLKLVDSSSVPVILPSDPEILRNGKMMMSKYWYTFTSHIGKIGYLVKGQRTAQEMPGLSVSPATDEVRNNRPSIFSQNETGWMGTWNEYGVVYAFNLYCDNPDEPLCETKDNLLKVSKNAVYVGGNIGKE